MGKDALIRPATGYSGFVRNICHVPGGASLERALLDPHCPVKHRRAYANHAGLALGIKWRAISHLAMDFGLTATLTSHPARMIRVKIGSRALTQARSARNRIRAGWCDESVTAGELLEASLSAINRHSSAQREL